MPVSRGRRNIVVFIVFVALLLDNLLLTAIVPILPNYFRKAGFSPGAKHNYDVPVLTTTASSNHENGITFTDTTLGQQARSLLEQIERSNHTSLDSGENTRMGILLGVKTFVQLICNFFVGSLINRVGYTLPMFSGFVILMLSTVLFAFTNSFRVLFTARAIQGLGTALSTTSGMGLLAVLFPDQRERGLAQTFAFSGLAAGVLIGPPYGGVLYDWTGGKEVPCLILAGVTLMEGIIQLLVIRPRFQPEAQKGSSFMKLLSDPYILLTAGSITMACLTVAVLEPVLPIWMFHSMGAPAWLQGVAFVPSTMSYLLSLQVFGALSHRLQCCGVGNRYISAFVGVMLLGSTTAVVPFCSDIYRLIVPLVISGIGLALVTSSMLPHVGYLVDLRHEPVYGNAYALTDNAFCLAFAMGPAISGPLVDSIGFSWTLMGIGVLTVALSPMVCLLRNPTAKQDLGKTEQTRLVEKVPGPRPPSTTYRTTDG